MQIKYIVIHCADTPNDREVTAKEVHQWHSNPKPKGNGWSGIGYHYFIRRSGQLESGRPEYWPGAHVRGHNSHSLGICLAGRDEFTKEQLNVLEHQVRKLLVLYPSAVVVGHRDLDSNKTCPNFDVSEWWGAVNGAQ